MIADIRRLILLLTVMASVACGGTVATPMVQVPLLRQRGEGEAGLVVGPASRRRELGAAFRYAATDRLRVGASLSSASGRSYGRDTRDLAPRLFADGFVGAEWGGLALRLGALAGAGYGLRPGSARVCRSDASEQVVCNTTSAEQTQFVRAYGQLHIAIAPPGPFATSLAVRVPVVFELDDREQTPTEVLGTELALTQTLRLRSLRLDLQPLWSRTRGFSFHVALMFRFDAGD